MRGWVESRKEKASTWFFGTCLVLLALALFLPALHYDFAHYDDDYHVIENPLIRSLHPRAIGAMFSRFHISSYYPVRLLSYALDYSVWRLNPRGYHLTNVAVHAANALLLFLLMLRVGASHAGAGRAQAGCAGEAGAMAGAGAIAAGPRLQVAAFMGAALFAVHPIVVEPVAWVAGREELLTTCFALLALRAYAGTLASGSPRPSRRWRGHAAAGVFCLLACLCNVLGALTAPLAVGLDLFLGPARPGQAAAKWRGILTRTAPLWAIGMVAVAVKAVGDAVAGPGRNVVPERVLTVAQRVLVVLNGYWLNIRALVWPRDLTVVFPNVIPMSALDAGVLLGAWLLLMTLAAVAFLTAHRKTWMLLGLLWFLVCLAPTSQIVPHHIFHADRFLYVPLAGLGFVAAGAVLACSTGRHLAAAVWGGALVLGALGLRSEGQLGIWHDARILFGHALRVYPLNEVAHNNLGVALGREGRLEDAVAHLSQALTVLPDYPNAHQNLGNAFARMGRLDEGIAHYSKALALEPRNADVLFGLGLVLSEAKRFDAAIETFSRSLGLRPDDAMLENNAGVALAALGRDAEAIAHYSRAVTLKPDYVDALYNTANLLARGGRAADAIACYSRVLDLAPGHVDAHHNLGVALARDGNLERALLHLTEARRLVPADRAVQSSYEEVRRVLEQRR